MIDQREFTTVVSIHIVYPADAVAKSAPLIIDKVFFLDVPEGIRINPALTRGILAEVGASIQSLACSSTLSQLKVVSASLEQLGKIVRFTHNVS